MTIEISKKAQLILSWLRDPTTKRFIKALLQDEKQLSQLAVIAMEQAANNGLTQRSEDEVKVFSELKATRILLSKIPYETLIKFDEGEKITEEDIKDLENFFEQLPN